MKLIRKKKSIAELLDGIDGAGGANPCREYRDDRKLAYKENAGDERSMEGAMHLARLGEAFLARLNIPDGMDEEEAVERIIAMWNEADALRAYGGETGAYGADEAWDETTDETADENTDENTDENADGAGHGDVRMSASKRTAYLPRPIRGGLFEAPKADYDSMSAEQFRRLKKQLERASMDGRRIRL